MRLGLVHLGFSGLIATAALAAACSSDSEEGAAFATKKAPTDTVVVHLTSYAVRADKASVVAGPIKFSAVNDTTSDVHELAVLRLRDDGTRQNGGESEDLKPGASGAIVLDLPRGKYELACLIAPGEEGSKVDHYQEGMHIEFEVR
ncbi:MAG: hypothetical protein EXR66_08720 [Dehalococcoidia bacterium]|nr:hypothetical protein [Dehalococcoidia bacterium]